MTRVQVLPQNAIPDPNGGGAAGNQFVMTSLYVRDLDPNVMDAQLYDLVNQLGQVVSVRVCRDLTSRRSLGGGSTCIKKGWDSDLKHDKGGERPIK
ncbi:hypothetical protein JHK86_014088 [Glycine max]|nr:hypothetical protein JHK86_014088 [Glycine max]